ncbi:hypothetical protein [Sphingomonas hylomeconis]|uniref:Uncharacterized protein n=2 Tax=Sphingomonas hylomeconis TaxID=1395958 RepID=A0ABV7SWQ7_9SPHN|nr:hypothetical protein [Sphingomonas hylomeconis]
MMTGRHTIRTAASLWLALAATTAQAATPCLTQPEAEGLVITLLPDMLDAVGQGCAASLPPEATLRAGLQPLVARYRADGPAVLPQTKTAFAKLIGQGVEGVDPDLMRPVITAMIAPMLAKEIKPADCPKVERMVTLIGPLPARNVAGIAVLLFTLGSDAKPGRSPFTICPLPAIPPLPAMPRP